MHVSISTGDSVSAADADLMAEGLSLYDGNAEIQAACRTLAISRFMYAHEYCLLRYRQVPVLYTSVSTTGKLKA